MTTKADSFIAAEEWFSAHNYHPLEVVIERAEGVWVYDVEGKRCLDCLSAYSAVNQGHCHPRIIQALIEQAGKVTLTSRAFRNDQFGLFAQELCEMTGYEMILPMNSGAEAVENALKERGLLCKETHQHTIRFAPPLVVTKEELDLALEQIEAVLS